MAKHFRGLILLLLCALCGHVFAAVASNVAIPATMSAKDYDFYTGDFNGDGYTDLLYIAKDPSHLSGIILSDGTTLSIPFQSWGNSYLGIPWSSGLYNVIVADFNGDGKDDILLQRKTPGDSYLLLTGKTGIVAISQTIANMTAGVEWSADQHRIVVGDFNGDGRADVFLQATTPGGLNAIILTDSNGQFTATAPVQSWNDGYLGFNWATSEAMVYAGDFNGDGRADLLIQAEPASGTGPGTSQPAVFPPNMNGVVLAQSGKQMFTAAGVQAWSQQGFGADWSPLDSAVVIGDFNGDGRADVILQGLTSYNQTYLLYGNSSGPIFSTSTILTSSIVPTADRFRLLVGHFDGTKGAGLLMQGQTSAQSNYFGHVSSASVLMAVQMPLTTESVSTTPTSVSVIPSVAHSMPTSGSPLAVTSAGRTAGQFSISPNGAATYNIPLWTPPGARNIKPHLALHFVSGGPDGVMGPGWTLTGTSAIVRCSKTVASDGVAEAVTLTTSDDLCLDGSRLRVTSGTSGMGGSTYLAEVADFSLVVAGGSASSPLTYFTVKGKDGRYYEYGNTADSKITASGASAPYMWMLDKVSDRQGNNMVFTYAGGTAATLSTIQYTATPGTGATYGYKVAFNYTQRTGGTSITKYVAGSAVTQSQELTNINVMSGGTSVRQYNLIYAASPTTNRPLLQSVQECGGSAGTDCLRPTTITYQSGAAGWSTSAVSTGISGQYSYIPIDLNGDGIPDALYLVKSGSNYLWYARIGTRSGFGPPIYTGLSATYYLPITPGNFSGGTGTQFLSLLNNVWTVFTFNGSGFTTAAVNVQGEVAGAVDYDGDGLSDLVSFSGNTVLVQRNVTTPGGAVTFASSATPVWTLVTSYQHTYLSLGSGAPATEAADFNGDGRQDLLVLAETDAPRGGVGYTYYALISNGFAAPATETAAIPSSFNGIAEPVAIGDINGDGCTDLFTYAYYYMSTCTGFVKVPTLAPNLGYPLPFIATDWDGDGQTDFLYAYNGEWYLERSTGSGLAGAVATGISAPTTRSFFTIDQNADGQPDLAYMDSANGYNISYLPHNGTNTPPDLASAITDGFGINFSPTYVPITQSNYTKGTTASYPDKDIQAPMYVVNQFSASDGRGGTYHDSFTYAGARLNLQGRGFEGFATTQSWDSRNGVYRKTTYRQDFPYTGSPSEIDVYQPNDTTLMSKTTNSYLQNELVSNSSGYSQSGTTCSWACFPYVSSTSVYHYEVGGQKNGNLVATDVTNTTYDAFGTATNTTSTTTDDDSAFPVSPFLGQSWLTTISNTVVNDTTNWCLGRPSLSKTTKTAAGEPSLTRTVGHTIDTVNCRATQEVVEPGDPRLQVTTNFGFDACGNTDSVSVIGLDQNGAAMPARTTKTSYGMRCQLPELVTNALNQTTVTAYRYDLGLKSAVTDPNGIAVSWTYDDFGRMTKGMRPDSTYTTWSYSDCVSATCWGDPDLRFLTQESLYSSSSTLLRQRDRFTDGLDRLRYDEVNRVLGVWTVQANFYDSLGRKTEVVLPYSSASNGYHLITYDLANRPTADNLYTSSGALYRTITMAYLGQTATVTDPNGHTTTKVTDVAGKLRSVTDPAVAPDPAGTTSYTYDSLGQLIKIVDPIGVPSTYSYNIRGFKTASTDADAGHWTFVPNSLNELVAQTDAKGQITSFGYDLLGRMTWRLEPESPTPTTWTYGVSAFDHNIGQLQSLAQPNGYAEQDIYDSDGRLQTKIYTEDGTNYQFDYSYNANGTIDTLTYPTSTSGYRFRLQYVYDNWGYLNQVKDANAGTTFWSLTTANDAGMPTLELLGNSVQVATGYTPWTNEMVSRTEGSGGSTTNLQDLGYTWDPAGNLQQRVDHRQGLTETFTLDAMNRLSTVTLNGNQTLSVTYDQAGDIETKSDVGTYTYGDPQHPHAVTAAGPWTMTYDANGNMASRAGGAITSYSYNLPDQINYNGSSSQFNYDANHQRWKQVANYSGTIETVHYIGGLLQVVNRGGVTEYRHQIPAGSSTAIYTRRSDGTSSTYYATSDHLGSADLVMDSAANVLVRESFGPFGARRGSNWQGLPTTADYSAIDSTTRQGFTGHEMLDTVSLVHMNGRVYDPTLGRFLSADTVIQSLGATQSINPYSYAWNDPLRYIDPSGHSILGAIAGIVAAIIAVWFMQPEVFAAVGQTMWATTAVGAGFVGGFVGAAVSTGSLSAAFDAGIIGALTAGLFYGAGTFAQAFARGTNWITPVSALAHAAVGCASAEMSSGNCGQGALSAAISDVAATEDVVKPYALGTWGSYRSTAEAGLIGGVTSRIVGGKFEDGFSVAAAGYLFNSIAHSLHAVPFTTDAGAQVLDYNNRPMMRPSDVNPGDIIMNGESGSPLGLKNFAQGGPWDFQRVGADLTFDPQFVDFANVAIGLYAAADGIPQSVALTVANYYAEGHSNFGPTFVADSQYSYLRVQAVYDIQLGYQLYNSGAVRSSMQMPPKMFGY